MSRHACCAPTATVPLPDLTDVTPTTRLPLSLVEQARGFANYHESAIFGSKEVGGIDTFACVGTVFSTLTYQPVVVSLSPSPSRPPLPPRPHRVVALVVTSPSVTLIIALPSPSPLVPITLTL